MLKYVCFNPGVINDDGVIRIYYGTQYDFEERIYSELADPKDFRKAFESHEDVIRSEQEMFHKSREEILDTQDSVMGPVQAVLEDDMLTIIEIVPSDDWTERTAAFDMNGGVYALTLKYRGSGRMELKELHWPE